MSKGSNRRHGKGFEENFDAIFSAKPIERGSFVQHPETGKMVPRSEYVRPANGREYAAVHGDIDSFVSPIDGSVIDDRGKLREHNKRHGVTNAADYSPEFLQKRRQDRNPTRKQEKQDRLSSIRQALHKQGFHD